MEDCLFCKIAAGEIPADIVYEDDQVLAFRDIEPQAPFHVLVVPRRHITSAFDLEDGDGDLLGALFAGAQEAARRDPAASDGVRILTNVGRSAGQVVMHLHFHVLGGRPMGWPPG